MASSQRRYRWKENFVSKGMCLLGIVLCLYLNLIEKCKCILIKPELPVDGNSGHFKYTTYDRNILELDI
jgi:hypothetical protein